MTEVLAALSGVHARSEATIRATQDWERGRLDSHALASVFREDVEGLLSLEETLGLDVISDGQMTASWQDLLRPFVTGAAGIRRGPLVRWYSTNTFFFAPVITGPIRYDGKGLRLVADGRHRIRKVVLPDPLTFADCSEDRYYRSREKLIFAYCDGALGPSLRRLAKEGAGYVQFSSPSAVWRGRNGRVSRDELGQVGEGLRGALKGSGLRSGYHTYFGDAAGVFQELLDLIPTEDIGFDLTETDARSLPGGAKGVIAGAADSRSSYVETASDIVERVRPVLDRFPSITLAPSCDLQFVPRAVADAKLASLAKAKERLKHD